MKFCSIKKSDFKRNHSANRFKTSLFLLFPVENGLDHSRYGIVVTKRNGNAINRNKIKRWFKNSLYQNIKSYGLENMDYTIIVNKYFDFSRANFLLIDKNIKDVFNQITQ